MDWQNVRPRTDDAPTYDLWAYENASEALAAVGPIITAVDTTTLRELMDATRSVSHHMNEGAGRIDPISDLDYRGAHTEWWYTWTIFVSAPFTVDREAAGMALARLHHDFNDIKWDQADERATQAERACVEMQAAVYNNALIPLNDALAREENDWEGDEETRPALYDRRVIAALWQRRLPCELALYVIGARDYERFRANADQYGSWLMDIEDL